MNFISRRHHGISTILSTTLMLAGVTVLGATMVMWSHGMVTSNETVLGTAASSDTNRYNEILSIENVWRCDGGGSPEPCHYTGITYPAINVTLTNIGSVGLNVTQITLNATKQNTNTFHTYSIRNIQLMPGQYVMWAQSYSFVQHKIPVTITVTTGRGSIFTNQVTPP
jgi:hypothetical protein